MSAVRPLPRWADIALLPLLNLALAFVVSGLVVLMIGQNPIEAMFAIVNGAFGNGFNLGYTLYYTTNFIFTGLAVAFAAHAGLFNIGANGQAYIAGLGVIIVALALQYTHWTLVMVAGIGAAVVWLGVAIWLGRAFTRRAAAQAGAARASFQASQSDASRAKNASGPDGA